MIWNKVVILIHVSNKTGKLVFSIYGVGVRIDFEWLRVINFSSLKLMVWFWVQIVRSVEFCSHLCR